MEAIVKAVLVVFAQSFRLVDAWLSVGQVCRECCRSIMDGRIMSEETFPITVFYSNVRELERAVLVSGLGLLRSIRHGEIVPDEAEGLLFTPGMHSALERRGISEQVLDFIARGFFLDDVLLISGEEKLQRMVDDMEALALALLAERPLGRRYAWALPTKPKDQP